jgi:LysM repeat protein
VRPKLTGPIKVIHHDPEGWNQIQRMWNKSVTEWQGAQGIELQIPFIFDQWGFNQSTGQRRMSIEKELSQLEHLAEFQPRLERTGIFLIQSNGVVPHDYTNDHTKKWICGGLDLGDDYILNYQENRCRQGGTFTALEWVPEKVIQSKNRIPTKPVPMSYRIKKGDTLVKIAVYYYGDGSRWRDIAKLNHINDPHHLKRGRTIKLPR